MAASLSSRGHGVKVGPGPWDPGPRNPGTRDPGTPQNLKVGPGTLLKFKSGTLGPPSNLKVGSQDPLQSLKVGPLTFL